MNKQPFKLDPAEFHRTAYRLVTETEHTLKDICSPEYWCHVSSQLKINDKIEVIHGEGKWYAELIVLAVIPQAAIVHCYLHSEIKENTQDIEDGDYYVKFRGPRKWSIIRRSDSQVIKEGIDTQTDANIELAQYRKSLAA